MTYGFTQPTRTSQGRRRPLLIHLGNAQRCQDTGPTHGYNFFIGCQNKISNRLASIPHSSRTVKLKMPETDAGCIFQMPHRCLLKPSISSHRINPEANYHLLESPWISGTLPEFNMIILRGPVCLSPSVQGTPSMEESISR